MHSATRLSVVAALLCLASASDAAPAHAHRDPPATPAASQAATGQRYATDAPLREGMRGIRAAVDALGHYEHGHMGPEQAAILAGQIQGHVNDIIANCKLPPDADAALHAVIVPLMTHAAALEKEPTKLDAIPPMRQALAAYATRFDDPGLAPEAEPEEER